MPDWFRDVRFAWRGLRRTQSFTVVAVATLALGIAVFTSLFAVVDALLFRPVPTATLDDAVMVGLGHEGSVFYNDLVPPDTIAALERTPAAGVRAVGGYRPLGGEPMIQAPGQAGRLGAEAVTSGYARVLQVPPQVGRWFVPEDEYGEASELVVVISDAIWREWLGHDRDAIGRTVVQVNGVSARVVGVAPPGFQGLSSLTRPVDLWLPAAQLPRFREADFALFETRLERAGVTAREDAARRRRSTFLDVRMIARLAPAPEGRAAETTLQTSLAALTDAGDDGPLRVRLQPLAEAVRPPLVTRYGIVLLALGLLVLLASCANLANMLYARGLARMGDTAIRLALGASRLRLFRAIVVETALIAALAAVAGLALALAASTLFSALYPAVTLDRYFRLTLRIAPDARVMAAAFGAALLATVGVGLATGWLTTRILPARGLAPSGIAPTATARGGWARTALVAIQVTVAFLLVMMTALGWEQLREELRRRQTYGYDVRYDVDRLVTGRLELAPYDYTETSGRELYRRLPDRIRQVEGVQGAALASSLPGGRRAAGPWTYFDEVTDDPLAGHPHRMAAAPVRVSPGFFAAIGVPIEAGRDIGPTDADGAPSVAVVTRAFADAIWPGLDPIGRRIRKPSQTIDDDVITVVGVVANPVESRDDEAYQPSHLVFQPFDQDYSGDALLVVRSDRPAAMPGPVQAAIRDLDDGIAVSELGTAREALFRWLRPQQLMTTLMSVMGAIALSIALLGVYGVVAYFVGLRRREFGVRLALGATPGRIGRQVVDYTIHVVLVGLLPGVLIASLSARFIQSTRFSVMPNDILTWIVVPVLVLAAGLAAGYRPARLAARVDPNEVLREL